MKVEPIAALGLAFFLALAAAHAAAPPSALVGTWTVERVYELKGMNYRPHQSPKDWYADKAMTISPDHILFGTEGCVDPTYTKHHGRLQAALEAFQGDKDFKLQKDFGVADPGPVDYYEIRCGQGEYFASGANAAPTTVPSSSYHPWVVALPSPASAAMPFVSGSWIRFTKAPG